MGEVLLICPDQYTGLTPKHLSRIQQFVSKVGEPVGSVSGS
jgi:hypothetical protein